MRSRITATASSNRGPTRHGRPGRGVTPLSGILLLAAVMALAGGMTVEARGPQEAGGPGDSGGSGENSRAPADRRERESGAQAAEPATFTDELVETACPCAGSEGTEAVPLSHLASGANAAQQDRFAARVASQEQLEELWTRVASTRVPQPEPPEVAFESHTVVAIFMGQQPSGGYSIGIDAVCRTGADTTIHLCYSAYQPAEDAIVTMALTSPYAFVAIPVPDADITVHRRTATR